MPSDTYRSLVVALFLLLAGCGTNVKTLLEEDARLFWQADSIVMAAEDLDRNLVERVVAAELAKIEACDALYSAAEENFDESEWSHAKKFWSDVTMLFVRVFPVESVERCSRRCVPCGVYIELRRGIGGPGAFLVCLALVGPAFPGRPRLFVLHCLCDFSLPICKRRTLRLGLASWEGSLS